MGEYSLLDYRFYLDIITSILFVILCIDHLKNRFPKMNKTAIYYNHNALQHI